MNLKNIILITAGTALLSTAAFGQSMQLKGKVVGLTKTEITLQSGSDTWTIARNAGTSISMGTLRLGSSVTLQCNTPDAHKNETPPASAPSPAASAR